MFVVDNRTWPLHSCGTKSGRFHSQEAPPLYFHHDKQNPKSFTDGKKIADDFRFGLVRRVCAFAEKCREILRCSFPGAADVGGALVSEESVVEIAVCPFSLHKPIKTARRSFEAKKKKLSLFFFLCRHFFLRRMVSITRPCIINSCSHAFFSCALSLCWNRCPSACTPRGGTQNCARHPQCSPERAREGRREGEMKYIQMIKATVQPKIMHTHRPL